MICIEIAETGQRLQIQREVWVIRNRNGIVITPQRVLAEGVGDGKRVWSLGTLEGYPQARLITRAEFEEHLTAPDPDPELSSEETLKILLGGNL